MTQKSSRYRWFVVAIFFFFMLLHQTDKLMIGSLQVPISEDIWNWHSGMGTYRFCRADCRNISISDLGLPLRPLCTCQIAWHWPLPSGVQPPG